MLDRVRSMVHSAEPNTPMYWVKFKFDASELVSPSTKGRYGSHECAAEMSSSNRDTFWATLVWFMKEF